MALPWTTQLSDLPRGDLGGWRVRKGTEHFGPVVAGEPTPDCELVTDITLSSPRRYLPEEARLSGWKYL